MMRLKGQHVHLAEQRFYALTIKGNRSRWVMHTIKSNLIPLWEELMLQCGSDEYVFSTGMKPGIVLVDANNINKKWNKWVKIKLSINADFYSLKHTHTTQIAKLKGEDIAAGHDGHTTGAMVAKIYNVSREEMLHNEMKDLPNTFTGS